MSHDDGGAKVWVLGFVLASGLGFAALIGVGCAIGANACPFGDPPAQQAGDGSELFLRNCAVCHGIEGQGARGPSLVTPPASTYTVAELEAKIARGRPLAGMPRYRSELTATQIRAVAEAVVALREGS